LANGLTGTARLGACTTSTRATRGTARVGFHAAVFPATLAAAFAVAVLTVTSRTGAIGTCLIGPGTSAVACGTRTRGTVRRQYLLFCPNSTVENTERFIDAPQDSLAPVSAARLRTTTSGAATR
jgi:hypothetical protein